MSTDTRPDGRLLYASDSEDNHEEPWTDSWDPAVCDAATGAREYAEETNLDVGDHVFVIEASDAREAPDSDVEEPETHGWPLDVHRTWRFRVVRADDDGVVIEEVTP